VNLFERLDDVRDRWNVLRHPFYRDWECGRLAPDDLAYYAGEYRHAVVALAQLAKQTSTPEHAAEEAMHVTLWDAFAHAVGGNTQRKPRIETQACADAWTQHADRLEGLAALYAIESSQPEIARTKLDGLVHHYGFDRASAATAYFSVHSERDDEHAELSRRELAAGVDRDDADRIVAAAERALAGNWTLLDGVDAYVDA
jgi:pyrroloquinoline quinone (PQQ) biosynthesis protein C